MPDLNGRNMLCLFPGIDSKGGVQASGRIAWETINKSGVSEEYLFSYDDHHRNNRNGHLRATTVTSKTGALAKALGRSWPVDRILVWHIRLLKLLPFFREPKARVILFLHGIEAWKRHDLMTRSLLGRVDLFLSNSGHTWGRFLEMNPEHSSTPHKIVHLGIGSPIDAAIPAPSLAPVALMISRLVKSEDYKGHREMIEAWPLVLEQVPDAELWIAGGGNLRKQLDRLAADSGARNSIRFLGEVSEEKKQEMLAACRCLVLPSRGEGFGLVYLEAMRMARPCMVSTQDAGCEVVNPPEAGIAVDLDNSEQVAESMCRLLAPSEEWSNWSAQAKRRYESLFTAEHFETRLMQVLSL